jgi:hypothetical protein
MAAVTKHDVTSWSESFLAQLERVRSGDDPAGWRSPESIRSALAKLEQTMDTPQPQPPPGSRKHKDYQGHTHVARAEIDPTKEPGQVR